MGENLFPILGWVIASIAIAAIAAGVAGDWIARRTGRRPQRRCPRCWYDLSRTSGLVCSECGHRARSERRLHRTRRHWRLVGCGIIVLLASHVVRTWPQVREVGWVGAVPTTALIVIGPWLRPDLDVVRTSIASYEADPGTSSVESPRDLLYLELARRLPSRRDNDLPKWQGRLLSLACRAATDDPDADRWYWDDPFDELIGLTRWKHGRRIQWHAWLNWSLHSDAEREFIVSTRHVWPHGAPVYARIRPAGRRWCERVVGEPLTEGLVSFQREWTVIACGMGLPDPLWSDGHFRLGTPASPETLRYRLSGRVSSLPVETYRGLGFVERWHEVDGQFVEIPMRIDGDVGALVTPVASEPFRSAFAEALHPDIEYARFCDEADPWGGEPKWGLSLGLWDTGPRELLRLIPGTTLALRIEILHGSRLVATGEAWFRDVGLRVSPSFHRIALEVRDQDLLRAGAKGAVQLDVRLAGDPYVALRDFDCTHYWDGEVEVPVTVTAR